MNARKAPISEIEKPEMLRPTNPRSIPITLQSAAKGTKMMPSVAMPKHPKMQAKIPDTTPSDRLPGRVGALDGLSHLVAGPRAEIGPVAPGDRAPQCGQNLVSALTCVPQSRQYDSANLPPEMIA
jgi:hypothetical protein